MGLPTLRFYSSKSMVIDLSSSSSTEQKFLVLRMMLLSRSLADLGSSGVTVTSAGALSADGRIVN